MPDNLENQPEPTPGSSFGGGGTGNRRLIATGSPEPEQLKGTVILELEQQMFRVQLDNGVEVRAHLSGVATQQRTFARLKSGHRVLVDISPYDSARGRILKCI